MWTAPVGPERFVNELLETVTLSAALLACDHMLTAPPSYPEDAVDGIAWTKLS